MNPSPRVLLAAAIPGLILGFSLSHIGFGDFGEVHRMFTLADLRLLFTFAGGVTLTALGVALFRRRHGLPSRRLHRGTLIGSAIFGAGWAVCGACPGIVLVQLGEGRFYGLLTLAGIVAGVWVGGRVQRAARLPSESC